MNTRKIVNSLVTITLLSCLSSTAFAHTAPKASERSVPSQLQMIQNTLQEMRADRLAMEARLNSRLDELQTSTNDLQGSADVLQATASSIYAEVTEVNIEMTTELCFDSGAKIEGTVGIEDEVGVGWPNVLSAKATLKGNGGFGGEIGVGNEICIQVPLYSVPSIHPLFDNGQEFDDLIAALALPNQTIVPIIADVYTALMPTPDESLMAIGNVTQASTGYNVYTGNFGVANPIDLLRPDVLLDPIVPQVAKDFVTYAPTAVEAALLDPCGTLENTPIGQALEGRDDVEFLCNAHADAIQAILPIINLILDVVDPLGLVH